MIKLINVLVNVGRVKLGIGWNSVIGSIVVIKVKMCSFFRVSD